MDDDRTAGYCDEIGSEPMTSGSAVFAPGMSRACLSALIDELDVGMLVCEPGGRLVHANAAGHQELRWSQLITLEAGEQVWASSLAQRQTLRSAMLATGHGRRQLVLLKSGAERLMVAVQPLPPAMPGAAPRALLLLGRRSVAPGLVVEMLCRLHDITSAEQRVLLGLLDGQHVEGLAREFGVKVSTVRTQVAALRGKLGVRRISDAMRLAAELPPMAGALRCLPHQARA